MATTVVPLKVKIGLCPNGQVIAQEVLDTITWPASQGTG